MIAPARRRTGLRSMRRIPVALTPEESAALNWLQHFARPDHLPRKFHPLLKLALHLTIKALSTSDMATLVRCHQLAEEPVAAASTPTP